MEEIDKLCPDNSTECLLKAILKVQLEQSTEYNWDPISVGITAAIGVLALLVASFTVFQGLLAAGPGRLKASSSAIGYYARYSKSSFQFAEMRVRTIAYTPLLYSNILEFAIQDWEDDDFPRVKAPFLGLDSRDF